MPTFADYTPKKGYRKGCPRCGAEKNAGVVTLQLRQLTGDTGRLAGVLTSRARNLCEPCCIEVYEHLLAALDEMTKPKVA